MDGKGAVRPVITTSTPQMSRRAALALLGTSAIGIGIAACGSPGPARVAASPSSPRLGTPTPPARLIPPDRMGIQLFTIRDKVSALGFRTVFEALAAIGYTEVEFAGYTQEGVGPITPSEIRQLLDDNGLRTAGAHVQLSSDSLNAELEAAATLGSSWLGQGGPISTENTTAGWTAATQAWNEMGIVAGDAGLGLYVHNHAGEFGFVDDNPAQRVYDILWEQLDPTLVRFELDVYWAYVGQHRFPGFEPVDYVVRDPDRFPLLHVKDGRRTAASADGFDIVELGAGDIPYAEFLGRLTDRGSRSGLYEQDNAPDVAAPPNPLDSLGNAERSFAHLAALTD